MKFVITIELNETSMRTGNDISYVLKRLGMMLERRPEMLGDEDQDWPSGQLKDMHGKKVGEWELL